MKAIPIYNPSKYGKAFCSVKKAANYILRGRAVMRPDGFLQFTVGNQIKFDARVEEDLAFSAAVAAGRGDTVYWNGNFPQASFPPGCNVQIERIPWRRSRRVRPAAE